MITMVAFQAYRRPLDMVTVFKNLGQVLTAYDDNWTQVVDNIWKARGRWACLSRILGREGADPLTSETFYKSLIQETLLFGSETWVMTPRIERTLGEFHHRVSFHLVAMKPKRYMEGMWEYPPLGAAMAAADLKEVETYLTKSSQRRPLLYARSQYMVSLNRHANIASQFHFFSKI